ncbi:MAG: PQQ-binding-like beta-propeller repeat protein, partial [Elusimicrobiota bacterium]
AGDMVEAGLRREFDKYNDIARAFHPKIKVYGVPGNHDVTRGMGAIYFRERVGSTRHAVLYPPLPGKPRFLFLAVNNSLSNHGSGHFTRDELRWVEAQLLDADSKYPGINIIAAFHHPTRESGENAAGEGVNVDNSQVFLELMKKYNIRALIAGHSHNNSKYAGNDGIPTFSTTGVYKKPNGGGFVIANVYDNRIDFINKSPGVPPNDKPFITVSLTTPRYPKHVFIAPKNDDMLNSGCHIRTEFTPYHNVTVTKAEYQVDDGGFIRKSTYSLDSTDFWLPMEFKTEGNTTTADTTFDVTELLKSFDAKNLRDKSDPWYWVNGIHRVKVRYTTSDNKKWYYTTWPYFKVRQDWPSSAWRVDVGNDVQADLGYDPDGERVYVNPHGKLFLALDALTGKTLWQFDKSKYGGTVWEESSGTVFDDSTVYFGSYNGTVFALNKTDGVLKWYFTVPTDAANEPDAGYPVSPVSVFGTPVFDDYNLYFGAVDGYLYAVDKQKGQLRWRYQAAREKSGSGGEFSHKEIITKPLLMNNKLYFTNYAGYIHCVNAKDGTPGWPPTGAVQVVDTFYNAPSRGAVVGNPVENVVYCTGYAKGVYCYNASTGELIWTSGSYWGSLGGDIEHTKAYAKTAGNTLCAYTISGEQWFLQLGIKDTGSDLLRNEPLGINGIVYTGTMCTGSVIAVKDNQSSGKLLWQHRSGIGGVTSTPAVNNNEKVFVGTLDGHITALTGLLYQ